MSRKRGEIFLVLGFICLYTVASAAVSLHRFWQVNAFWYDFGIIDEAIWKLSRFQLPNIIQLNPPVGKIIWADHFQPSLAFLAPLYWFTQRQEIMFVAQAVFVGLSAIIAYLISRKIVENAILRVALIVSYLGFVGLQNALITDIHTIVLALLPFMISLWAYFYKKWKLYFIFVFITLGFQENLSFMVTLLGIYIILRGEKQIKIGLVTIICGLLYGFVSTKFIIPFFKSGPYSYEPVFPQYWYGWLTGFINPPDMKLKTIVVSLATFGFLPIAAISTLPLIIGHFLERFVLNIAGTRWDLGLHYNALLSPILFIASIETISKLQQNKKIKRLLSYWGIVIMVAVFFLHRFYLHGPLLLATHPVFYKQTKEAEFLRTFIAKIPKDELIMTQNNIATYFTHGKVMLLNEDYNNIRPEVIALDLRGGQNANNFFPLTPDETAKLAASISGNLKYKKLAITSEQFIFLRR